MDRLRVSISCEAYRGWLRNESERILIAALIPRLICIQTGIPLRTLLSPAPWALPMRLRKGISTGRR